MLSQANVRRIKAGVSIEELAEDIARRTLLQSLTVRPVLDESGAETGMFEVPAGGRRYRALELLVKQKRLARNAPIPCIVRTEGLAEEDSLAENVQRAPLHPLDQFRAFVALREKGQSEEEIAAAFFVSVAVVKQRLKLAAVSPKLLDVYAEDGMTLDQLMAFTVNPDHERQEQVWEAIAHAWSKEPHQIRRMLTENAVRASDKRAQFIGIEAYEAAGGIDPARPLPVRRRRLAAGPGPGRPARGGEARAGGRNRPGGRLEVDRGRGRLPLWPHLRSAAPLRRADPADRRGDGRARGAAGRVSSSSSRPMPRPTSCRRRSTSGSARSRRRSKPSRTVRCPTSPRTSPVRGAFVSIDGSGHLRIERGYVRPEDEAPVVDTEATESDGAEAGEPQVNGVAPSRRARARPRLPSPRRTTGSGRFPTGW